VSSTREWSRQWEREKAQRKHDPLWNPRGLDRVQQVSLFEKAPFLPADLDGRIVICELLNSFPSLVFPNPTELHASIRYGIRPLLYSILRNEFLHPRELGACQDERCRKVFKLKRADQHFCSSLCSRQQRQRTYWKKSGKKLRAAREKQKRRSSR
jgi:hypothetical protein